MKDYTREILLEKYGHSIPVKPEVSAPAQEQQAQDIRKAAGGFPAVCDYQTIDLWLKAVAAASKDWPDGIREAVVAEQLKKHRLH